MWNKRHKNTGRVGRFFRIGLSHDSLANHYTVNFAMIQHHNWNLTELENMIPFERQIYVDMLMEHVEQENEKMNQAKRSH